MLASSGARLDEASILDIVGTYRKATIRRVFMSAQASTRSATVPADSAESCPITPVVDLVFSRWTTPILWMLNEHGRQRFVELQRRIVTITPKVLTQRLRQLERDGLIERTYHPEVPPRVEYEITEL